MQIVCVDLVTSQWPLYPAPYLHSVHASAVTTLTYIADVSRTVYDRLDQFGRDQEPGSGVSTRPWPVCGGVADAPTAAETAAAPTDILITGHEDGSVKFWSCGGVGLRQVATVKTAKFFIGEDDLDEPAENGEEEEREDEEEEEDEWPPFRKVGKFDPYSDDPRLAVKKVKRLSSY